MWAKNDKKWIAIGVVFIGVAIFVVFAAWRAREEREDQAAIDAGWQQLILDSKRAGNLGEASRFDCEWMQDILKGDAPSTVITPGTTPVVLAGNWPSKAVAQEYLTELC